MMRTLLLALSLMGVAAMSEVAVADEKKDPPKSPSKADNYDLKATVRQWNSATKKFLNPVKDQPAMMGEISGKKVIYTMPEAGNVKTPKGSEITIGDVTYVVDKVTELNASGYHINYVTPKPKDK